MTQEELEALLRTWGRALGESAGGEIPEDAHAPDVHPLARAARYAPGRRDEVLRQRTAYHRAGMARRALMARDLAECGVRIVPAAYVDPVPGSRSSVGGAKPPWQSVRQAEVDRVQSAWVVLHRLEPLRATVLMHEYQVRGMTQRDKAARLAVKVRRYRDELQAGKIWMHGRLTVT